MAFPIRAKFGDLRELDGTSLSTSVVCFEPITENVRELQFFNSSDVDVYVYINTGTDFTTAQLRVGAGTGQAHDIAANKQQTGSFELDKPLIVCFKGTGVGTTGAFWMHTLIGD